MHTLTGPNGGKTLAHATETSAAHAASAEAQYEGPGAGASPGRSGPSYRVVDLQEGARRLALVQRARPLREAGLSWRDIGGRVGHDWQAVRRFCMRVGHLAEPTAEDLAWEIRQGRRKRKYQPTPGDVAALARNTLITNRTETSGSVEEAARMALRKGQLSEDFAQQLRDRINGGLTVVPERIRREVMPSPATVKQFRNPTDAALDYLNAPGSMMWIRDRVTGEERFMRAGDALEADDATINFIACVPWQIGGCPCSDKWGVKVGRFQLLLSIDAGSRFIPGYSYTARPRSSYRGEDVVSLLNVVFRQHGIWQRCRFEQGVWKSALVKSALELLGVELQTVWSPHQKPFIEGLFNVLWTKLSDLPGQVGRFRGEEERADPIFRSCLAGASDPRQHFVMLGDLTAALDSVISERNETRIKSVNYGTWLPRERWEQQRGEGRLRRVDPASAWMFSPMVREWTVRGCVVGGTVPIMEGFSVRFDFTAPWMTEFDGCRVRLHFDPSAPNGSAVAVLLHHVRDHAAGEVLGACVQVNKVARYARQTFGWGDDPDLGLELRKQSASALRREVRAIVPDGKPAVQVSEAHDGLGNAAIVERGLPGAGSEPAALLPQPRKAAAERSPFAPATTDQLTRQARRVAEAAEDARMLRELQEA